MKINICGNCGYIYIYRYIAGNLHEAKDRCYMCTLAYVHAAAICAPYRCVRLLCKGASNNRKISYALI